MKLRLRPWPVRWFNSYCVWRGLGLPRWRSFYFGFRIAFSHWFVR